MREEKNKLIWQDNSFTAARYDMSSVEKNILYMVISQIKKGDSCEKVYPVSEKEIMRITGTVINSKQFREAAGKLRNRNIDYHTPERFIQTNFIATAEHIKNKGIIEIQLSKRAMEFFLNLKEKFTTYELDTALLLTSKYSKRMYEVCSMYKNFPNKSFTMSIIELKQMFRIIDEKGKDSYPSYSDFKKAVLIPSQAELKEKADVVFDFEEIEGKNYGKGRKPIETIRFTVQVIAKPIETIRFTVQVIAKPDLERFVTLSEIQHEMIEKLIERLKLRRDQAISVVEKYSREEINKMCYDMSLQKPKIRNIGAYAAKTFGLV